MYSNFAFIWHELPSIRPCRLNKGAPIREVFGSNASTIYILKTFLTLNILPWHFQNNLVSVGSNFLSWCPLCIDQKNQNHIFPNTPYKYTQNVWTGSGGRRATSNLTLRVLFVLAVSYISTSLSVAVYFSFTWVSVPYVFRSLFEMEWGFWMWSLIWHYNIRWRHL